jgi:hypothetical protein
MNINHIEEFKNNEFKQHCEDYTFTPFIFPKVNRIIVFGDIHGDYDMIVKLFQMSNLARIVKERKISRTKTIQRKIKKKNRKNRKQNRIEETEISITESITEEEIEYEMEWIGSDTYVVQVGDQIDRCRPNGTYTCDNPKAIEEGDEDSDIKILKLFTNLHEQAVKYGGAVISLFGNHELLNAMGEVQYVSFKGLRNIFKKYKIDGVEFEDGIEARKHAFKPGNEYGKFLGCTRNATVIIGSNLFVHAGIIDTLINELGFTGYIDVEQVNILIKKWLLGLVQTNKVSNIVRSQNSMFWTRVLGSIPAGVPVDYPSCSDNISQVLKLFNVDRMIIGHTPQSFLFSKDINGTCGDKIWRVDNGSSAAFDMFDENYRRYKEKHPNRRLQYLEIINDNEYHVYDESGKVY